MIPTLERLAVSGLTNAASALVLALAALCASRWMRRPELRHAAWLVVLLDLLTPPLIGIAVVPGRPAWSPGTTWPSTLAGVPAPQRLERLALLAWGLAAAVLALLALVRALRLRRCLLAEAPAAPAEIQRSAAALAAELGLARCPRIRLTGARVSPLLWPRLRGPELLLPRGLLAALTPGERDAILAHELAHACRRDHLARFVELAATCLFFWHPAVWWARGRLRAAEERCCDARVVQAWPALAGDLARALVKTVEFLGPAPPPPIPASAAVGAADLKERLAMILRPASRPPLARPARLLLASGAALALLAFPTRAAQPPEAAAAAAARAQEDEARHLAALELELLRRHDTPRAEEDEARHLAALELELKRQHQARAALARDQDRHLAELEVERERPDDRRARIERSRAELDAARRAVERAVAALRLSAERLERELRGELARKPL